VTDASDLELPPRYERLARLGKGGGGEVWSVRDCHTGGRFALKVLSPDASEHEMAALVREAVALSGLEGLGLPRIQRFGRLPGSLRPYLVRELVEGKSLADCVDQGCAVTAALEALVAAADQLTELHRAGLFHGDIKPANIIVPPTGRATLVDLGLAAPWQELGTIPEGLTPKYAAPELFLGKPLTVRAEVFALGTTLAEVLDLCADENIDGSQREELRRIAQRATERSPEERHPSADELAAAVRRAARFAEPEPTADDVLVWPVAGIDGTASVLLDIVRGLSAGEVLRVAGPEGAGKTALLRRVAWSLGVEGRSVVWLDRAAAETTEAIAAELATLDLRDGIALVDDAEAFVGTPADLVHALRDAGARLVVVGDARFGVTRVFEVPPLDLRIAMDLLRRAVPSLTDHLVSRAVELSDGRPGKLRHLVRLMARNAVASTADIERALGRTVQSDRDVPSDPCELARHHLDRGRYNEARAALDGTPDDVLDFVIEKARLELALGDSAVALERLQQAERLTKRAPADVQRRWQLYLGRAYVGVADYVTADTLLGELVNARDAVAAEALAFRGLALSYLGRHEEARRVLDEALAVARVARAERVEAIAYSSLGVVLQRDDRVDEARVAYERALAVAERAGEAGLVGSAQLNLAGVLKMSGDLAGSIVHFEAAVDMGRRSGRRSTVRNALLNLANTDLYLGRLARARSSIEALEEQRSSLPAVIQAQLTGLSAELAAKTGDLELAGRLYDACADAYVALSRSVDAAEARLEGVLVLARAPNADPVALARRLALAEQELGDTLAHRALLLLAQARVAALSGDAETARTRVEGALNAAREARQREWVWRGLEARAEFAQADGQSIAARRDREEALAVLEEIGARLPRDLREVYWNDPRRRALRKSVQEQIGHANTESLPVRSPGRWDLPMVTLESPAPATQNSQSLSELSRTPLEQRLARILEINAELAGEHDLDRLVERVIAHAVELLNAERGLVLLVQQDGSLSVHASRTRSGEPNAEFSRSIARQVISKGEPMISLSAGEDARLRGYASVHQHMLKAVACVPIMSPSGRAIGALYLETRRSPSEQFGREVPTLRAFADQVAIAIETARLVSENKSRADELEKANVRLEEAHGRVRELLGDRTAALKKARQQLRATRETLYGHFGYHGLVGTSAAMRRVYALVDRVKDTDVPVLITGESGTGKEMVARAIHEASSRSKARFLGVNCGAIPDNLLESELFGHVRGAFTGADRERKGLFRECEGGTVLLDEIGEMPTKMQAGMLRVLQERRVRPVGGTSEEPVDVRLVFATHRDLQAMVRENRFREDLFYRIHVVAVEVPPLRKRAEDVPQLVDHFLGRFAVRYKRDKKTLTREALRYLMSYDWPGNVRQLEHVLLNAWVLAERSELDVEDFALPGGLPSYAPRAPEPEAPAAQPPAARREAETESQHRRARSREPSKPNPAAGRRPVSQHRNDERTRILDALKQCNWNRVRAAEVVGIPRRTFYRRLREYGIQ
jgi:transcriptional regulator with GAF, ATPase, and Fis domain/tetratricopeptide (TPR) repeat protein